MIANAKMPVTVVACLLLFAVLAAVNTAAGAETKFKTADEAWNVGVAHYNARNYAASREPFEAALELAPDDKFRVKVYDALLTVYRQLPEIDKFLEASDFIFEKSESSAKRSITRRALLSFVHERGKVDDLAQRYEAVLKEDEENRTALYILSEIYSRLKPDPDRAVELTERLAKLSEQVGEPFGVLESAELAGQYVKAKKLKQGAELYEKIAPLDENLAAWHWKEAASVWLLAGDKARALAAANKAHESPPEARNDLLAHFWHRNLADTFLTLGEPKLAIPHYEAAIAKTNIEGYIKDCKTSLAEAREKAGE